MFVSCINELGLNCYMKNWILLLLLFPSLLVTAQEEINWMTMNEALAAQQSDKNPKRIFMDVYTIWCGPCIQLDKRTFTNPDLVEFVNKNYYPVKFDAEGTETIHYLNNEYTFPNHKPGLRQQRGQHEFARALKVQGYPSMAFFDDKGNFIQTITGYHTPKQLEIYLKMIANDDYKDITTGEKWENYQKEFKYEWRNF